MAFQVVQKKFESEMSWAHRTNQTV